MIGEEEDNGAVPLPPRLALVDEPFAAWCAAHYLGEDENDPTVLARWRSVISVWAARGRLTRHGTDQRGGRRYDLHQLETLLATWRRRVPKPPTPMDPDQRVAAYLAQTGRPTLTVRQQRQIRRQARQPGHLPPTPPAATGDGELDRR